MANELMDEAMRRTVELANAAQPDKIFSDPVVKEFVKSAYDTILLRLANQGLQNLRAELIVTDIPAHTDVSARRTRDVLPDPVVGTPDWRHGLDRDA